MANHKSALKRIRQSEKRRLHNRTFRTRARTFVKNARKAIHASTPDISAAEEATRLAVQDLDKAASRGVIHPRNAARRKSRLMKQLAAIKAAQAQKQA
jgi:small subunit ribosomal protein S20